MSGKPSAKGYIKKLREKQLQGKGDVGLKYMFTNEYWNRVCLLYTSPSPRDS